MLISALLGARDVVLPPLEIGICEFCSYFSYYAMPALLTFSTIMLAKANDYAPHYAPLSSMLSLLSVACHVTCKPPDLKVLCQPFSAVVVRVFSTLKNSSRNGSLEDQLARYIELH